MTLSTLDLNFSRLKLIYRSIYTRCTLSLDLLSLNVSSNVILRLVTLSSLITTSALPCLALDEWLSVGLESLTMVAYFKLVL
jgi:hypothetical protein